MNTIHRFLACTATSALLAIGAVALAAPAQAESRVGAHTAVTDHSGQRDEPTFPGGGGLLGIGVSLGNLLGLHISGDVQDAFETLS